MRRFALFVPATLVAVTVFACDRASSPTDPKSQASVRNGSPDSGVVDPPDSGRRGGGGSGGGGGVDTSVTDTSSRYRGVVHVTLTVGAVRPGTTGPDTLVLTPVAGATIDVPGVLQLLASPIVTDANGNAAFDLPQTGPYLIRATPPANSGLRSDSVQVYLDRPNAPITIRLFQNR